MANSKQTPEADELDHYPPNTAELELQMRDRAAAKKAKAAPLVTIRQNDRRPHGDLALVAEGETVAASLHATRTVTSDITLHESEPASGMPDPRGEYRPLLLTFSAIDPVSRLAVVFRCSVGELYRAMETQPEGNWTLDFEGRTVRRETH